MSEMRSRYIECDSGEPILVAYYDGANGKTLRVDTQTTNSLEAVVRLFEELSKGGNAERSFRDIPQAILVPPLVDVLLGKSRRPEIRAAKKSEDEMVFITWNQPGSVWEDASELLKQLLQPERANKPGHQYLTDFGIGILVEVAFRE